MFHKLPSDLKAQGLESGWMDVLSKQGNGFWHRINYLISILQQIFTNLELSVRVRVLINEITFSD